MKGPAVFSYPGLADPNFFDIPAFMISVNVAKKSGKISLGKGRHHIAPGPS